MYTVEDILNKVTGGNQPEQEPQFQFTDPSKMQIQKAKGLQAADFSISKDALYNRTSDGMYIPRFENYMGAEGNEDRLAQSQGFFEQASRGLGKAVVKTGAYAVDATLGTVYGLFNGIKEGSWSSVWNNEFSQSIDDFNTRLDSNLVSYYTDEEKANGLLAAIPGFGATNFWFNDVAGGMAFVVGAVLPEIAIGALTGGTSLGVGIAKGVAKKAFKEAAEETTEKFLRNTLNPFKDTKAFRAYERGSDLIRNQSRMAFGKTTGDIVSTTAFLARTSNFEAGMEARQNFKTAVDDYYRTFEDKNGRPPTYEESTEFLNAAKSSSNGVYAANMGILAISNAVMFGRKFNIGQNLERNINGFGNRIIGLGTKTDEAGKLAMRESNRLQKVLGTSYKILGKPAIEGIYEEGFQGVVGKTMQNYLKAKYDPEIESGYTMMSSLADAFAEQYGTAEGWKEMGVGMIIGSLGGKMQKGGSIAGFGRDSYKAVKERVEGEVKVANEGTDNLMRRVNRATTMANFGNQKKSGSEEVDVNDIDNAFINVEYVKSQEHVKSHKEILADYEAVVDKMEVSDSQLDLLGGEANVPQYKAKLKEEFQRNLSDYKTAKSIVRSLGLDRTLKETPGSLSEIADYITMSIIAGKQSLHYAKNTAAQLDTLIGSEGLFNYLEHYNNLSKDKRSEVEKLKRRNSKLEELRETAAKISVEIASVQTKDSKNPEAKQKAYNKVAERYSRVTQQIADLEAELKVTEEALNSRLRAGSFTVDKLLTTEGGTEDILETVAQLDKVDKFVESLRVVGKQDAADSIEYLLDQYKRHSDAHREMNSGIGRMMDTNFFQSKEGKGLRGKILGNKYESSEEFKKTIRENDAKIDASLKLVGVRGEATVQETIDKYLGENPELSDREKYRLESIIRMQLGYKNFQDRLEAIEKSTEVIESEEDTSTEPLEGDKVTLKQKLENQEEGKSNLDVLNEVIAEIISEIDALRNTRTSDNEEREPFKLIETADYKRFLELVKKSREEELSTEEIEELQELTDDIDQWTIISGTVVDGIRLSDLIRQKIALENMSVEPLENIPEVTSQEILEASELSDKSSNSNQTLTQTYDAVTATRVGKGKVEISGIDPKTFMEEVGFTFDYKLDEQKNIIIEDIEGSDVSIIDRINQDSPISILPTNRNLTTNYSVVLKTETKIGGGTKTGKLKSTHPRDFKKNMKPNSLYNMKDGDVVTFRISPEDKWNANLLDSYRKAKTAKDKANVLLKIAQRLTIQVINKDGDFVSVLKAKRKLSGKESKEELRFRAFRDQIANDEDLINQLAFIKEDRKVEIEGVITVKKVYMGQPNTNVTKNADGSHTIDFVRITEQDLDLIDDFGIVKNGKPDTRTQRGDIDMTFLNKIIERNPKAKIPIIVINKGVRRIAYPVRLDKVEKQGLEEFTEVYQSKIEDFRKAIRLNEILAERGVDTSVTGNSFVAIGDKNNLNDEFFSNKLSQLENISYFSDLDTWLDNKIPLTEILKTGVSVDIDLHDPFHSPKLQLDYSGLDVDVNVTSVRGVEKEETLSEGANMLREMVNKSGEKTEAQDQIDKDC